MLFAVKRSSCHLIETSASNGIETGNPINLARSNKACEIYLGLKIQIQSKISSDFPPPTTQVRATNLLLERG